MERDSRKIPAETGAEYAPTCDNRAKRFVNAERIPMSGNASNQGRHAIVIGIDAYQGENELFGCVNDAKEIADHLTLEQYDYDVTLLFDRQATRDAIMNAIGRLAYTMRPTTPSCFISQGMAPYWEMLGTCAPSTEPTGIQESPSPTSPSPWRLHLHTTAKSSRSSIAAIPALG
ncbi:caspase family protein [Microbacteriaceae bacterium VKM Ac-2854]|nr:caspase family protein [Microbacteriaceae bacterium VKM Ac-2854]